MALFKEPENLPAFLAMSLPATTGEEQLHLFELLHPAHRLLISGVVIVTKVNRLS